MYNFNLCICYVETTCNPDSKFSVCALSKLEAIGIQVP